MNLRTLAPLTGLYLLTSACNETDKGEITKPNFLIIYCDDLGYGDLSCFGATDIHTPNIDRIANEGIQFTEFYSGSPVCSPSRAALLTGRYPQRMGINSVFFPESYTGIPEDEITIAEGLKTAGYTCGIVGKWHLGHMPKFLPLNNGFDEYFGIPYSNDMESVVYMRNNAVVDYHVDQHYITKTYTKEAINFIEKQKDKPFFLYLAHNMPHVPIYASEDFVGTSRRGLYGDVVQELDWSTGEILKKLEDMQLLENTLIVFSSDNGPWLVMKELGGSAGILREGKQYTFEGGQRVPALAMWKGKIKPGSKYENMACMMDWFPTFLSLAGVSVPNDRAIDGENISRVLFGTGQRSKDEFLYFDGSDLQCYRNGDYKVKKPFAGFPGAAWKQPVPAHDSLLINLKKDPGERNNLALSEKKKMQELFKQMEKRYGEMGELPPSLVIKTPSDDSHYEYLIEQYGEEYWKVGK